MNIQSINLATSQRGEGGIAGIVSMIILAVMVMKLGIAIVPAHLEDRTLTEIMGKKLKQSNDNKKDVFHLFAEVDKQMGRSGFNDITPKDIFQVVSDNPGSIKIKRKYIKESMLFPGVYITNKFEGPVEEVSPK